MFGADIVHVVFMASVAYAMMKFMKRDVQQKAVMAWVLFYLSCSHLDSVINKFGSYDMNITTYTMLLVCKLSALSFCYKDGGMDESKLTADQKARQVKDLPSVLEFCSYVWYCCACALGVFFEFSDYKRFIERSHEYENIPSPILPSLKMFATSMSCLIIYVIGNNFFPMDMCWSDDYFKYGFLQRIVYYHVSMTFKRFFYYGPFSATTGACIASGLGYNGVKKHVVNETEEESDNQNKDKSKVTH